MDRRGAVRSHESPVSDRRSQDAASSTVPIAKRLILVEGAAV